MNDRYFVVRRQPAVDLVDLARQAALVLRDRLNDPVAMALAAAIDGATSEVALDLAEPVLS